MRIIRTHHAFPPIPIRCFDWMAWVDGTEENGPYGHGKTEEEARANLGAEIEACAEQKWIDENP